VMHSAETVATSSGFSSPSPVNGVLVLRTRHQAMIRYGVPFWLRRFPKSSKPTYPQQRGALDVDVASSAGA